MTLTEMFLQLARARNCTQRASVLFEASRSARFDEDQRAELLKLYDECRQAGATVYTVRPLTNPAQENAALAALKPGPRPLLPPELWGQIEEWAEGWNRADELFVNQLEPPGALLLHGPTGTGKTMLTRFLAGALPGRAAVVLEAHSVLTSFFGATGERLAKVFDSVNRSGALLVLEELDALAVVRAGQRGEEESNRVTVAVMRLIEAAGFPVIATTNRLDALDAALLRRFEVVLEIPPPPPELQRRILAGLLAAECPDDLLAMGLAQAVPEAKRRRRREFLGRQKAE